MGSKAYPQKVNEVASEFVINGRFFSRKGVHGVSGDCLFLGIRGFGRDMYYKNDNSCGLLSLLFRCFMGSGASSVFSLFYTLRGEVSLISVPLFASGLAYGRDYES